MQGESQYTQRDKVSNSFASNSLREGINWSHYTRTGLRLLNPSNSMSDASGFGGTMVSNNQPVETALDLP